MEDRTTTLPHLILVELLVPSLPVIPVTQFTQCSTPKSQGHQVTACIKGEGDAQRRKRTRMYREVRGAPVPSSPRRDGPVTRVGVVIM